MEAGSESAEDVRARVAAQRRALREALRVQAAALHRLLRAITTAYEDELEQIDRSPEQRRGERVRRLLDGATTERPEFGYELDGWHLGAIAVGDQAGQAERAIRALATDAGRPLLSVPRGERSVWAWLGGGERSTLADLARILAGAEPSAGAAPPAGLAPPAGVASPTGVVLALGEPARGLEGWRLTHRQAQAALAVALRRSESRGARESIPLTRYADVALLATALQDPALAGVLIDAYIAPLEDARNGGSVLCRTLRAYLAAERSVSSTAAALGVVRKTVESRLRTIEERLGRTLHPCLPELEVALLLDELALAPTPPGISTTG